MEHQIERKILEENMEEGDRVTGWLEELEIGDLSDEAKESTHAVEEQEQPRTPPRRLKITPDIYESVSPTNTSFYNSSVFDSRKDLRSPRFCIRDDASDATSVDDDDNDWTNSKTNQKRFVTPKTVYNTPSIDSYKPPSDIDEALQDELPNTNPPIHLPPSPGESRLVCITSCLQCTLADLPCSLTVPSCSRCERNGMGDVCLLHRRRFIEEDTQDAALAWSVPVLLKLVGEDEGRWRKKVDLAYQLHAQWQDEQDRRNWVLPRWGERKMEESYIVKVHPGEGKGRLTYRELKIEM
ncbi:hypothetical protein P153DRAFT_41528 [Dothidotthia symphoricarpi CBS 119687]|uniref:Zn(2)-C6 fungal-type domain-containing protein n=1 Tax=Dothidotthia symphoricarpi CBS 119687 TaxID=1392245 RepID=A0A6A6AC91_9PLEO|nr:uncharacterized protein P153DRAFT_41528 [Dothidotthia symphoricarpi CBS 119687]KAF2128624.1 hypothetical protein P153DRAFT_41528 [Dothidotthia symphoricarpi CBS 119687]